MNNSALDGFIQRHKSGRFWIGLYLITVVIFTALYFRLATAFETRPRFLVVNQDTLLVSQELDFTAAKELHIGQAERVVRAMFNRNSGGLESPGLLKRLLDKPSYDKLLQIVQGEMPEVEAKELRQKVEISEVKIVQMQNRSVDIVVEGQLIRNGRFDGRSFVEAAEIKVSMLFTHNPSLLENGLYPTIVRDFTIETTPIPLR